MTCWGEVKLKKKTLHSIFHTLTLLQPQQAPKISEQIQINFPHLVIKKKKIEEMRILK